MKIISPHDVELDMPTGIHPRFHIDLLKRVADDPLPSQLQDDDQPMPIDNSIPRLDQQFIVELIVRAENHRYGREFKRMLLVKWQGQAEISWEPQSEFENNLALDTFENTCGTADSIGEPNTELSKQKKKYK